MKDKSLYWSIRLALGIFGIVALYQFIPYLLKSIDLLLYLLKSYSISDANPEYKLIFFFASIYISCIAITTITNIVFKIHELLEDKYLVKGKGNDI